MVKINFFKGILFLVFFSACSNSKYSQNKISETPSVDQVKILMAAYQQKAAEYRALCYQAYNIARWRLDEFIKTESSKPFAIITDIDETVLDNSPEQVHQALKGKGYDQKEWYEWSSRAIADTIPGALGFLKYANSKGVEIFYISNRHLLEHNSTLQNLKKFGFPNADDAHLKLMGSTSSKIPRRDSISMTHNIIMLIGDNLNDLNGNFEKKDIAQRFQITNDFREELGRHYIVLPNPSYGDWENALFNYKYNLSTSQKDSIFRSILRSY